ncbi:nucleoside diphosphate kinase-like protein [Medicago truncatula]|uniref:Nucleoside diphosphate kinase-like protein n=1 Tax=Medicago truncatula TaxID=3880 RepID=A0A072TNT0_MEDTR|nr:nucleoside diphosphate kinase-like protein [Medicago truncatula]
MDKYHFVKKGCLWMYDLFLSMFFRLLVVAGHCRFLVLQMRPPFVGFIRLLGLLVFVSACCCSSSPDGSTNIEKTLAIIKPDGLLGNYTDDIKRTILEYGFSIVKEKIVQLDETTVKRFYAEHSSKNFFSSLVKYMTSGPVLTMVLEKDNAIADWRALMGPTDASKAKITHPHSGNNERSRISCEAWILLGLDMCRFPTLMALERHMSDNSDKCFK